MGLILLLGFAAISLLHAQTGQNVLLVVNRNSSVSRQIADYYRPRRSIPAGNVCYVDTTAGDTTADEEISWQIYEQQIERPVGDCLKRAGLHEKVLYLVTTLGLPLKVRGAGGQLTAEYGSVDSELALLYGKLQGTKYPRAGPVANPFFKQRDVPFRHPQFPIYLVTRLAAFDFDDVKAMIDRGLAARNRGKFVLDLRSEGEADGDNWLRNAAILLPAERTVVDETKRVLYDQSDVIGYAGWGSNDENRKRRRLGFRWLPGAIVTEFVSTNAVHRLVAPVEAAPV